MKERRTHHAFKSALLFPGEDKVTKVAPILFEDGKKNMKRMFKCKHLALVGAASRQRRVRVDGMTCMKYSPRYLYYYF